MVCKTMKDDNMNDSCVPLILDEIPSYSFRRLQARLCELQRQYEITEAYLKAKYANKSTL